MVDEGKKSVGGATARVWVSAWSVFTDRLQIGVMRSQNVCEFTCAQFQMKR